MSVALSWLLIMLLFAVAWLGQDQIARFMDRVIDLMGWGPAPARDWVDQDKPCPCGQDRTFHHRMGLRAWDLDSKSQDERDYLSMLDDEAREGEDHR